MAPKNHRFIKIFLANYLAYFTTIADNIFWGNMFALWASWITAYRFFRFLSLSKLYSFLKVYLGGGLTPSCQTVWCLAGLCRQQYNKIVLLHLIVAPQLRSGWWQNYSTKTRLATVPMSSLCILLCLYVRLNNLACFKTTLSNTNPWRRDVNLSIFSKSRFWIFVETKQDVWPNAC